MSAAVWLFAVRRCAGCNVTTQQLSLMNFTPQRELRLPVNIPSTKEPNTRPLMYPNFWSDATVHNKKSCRGTFIADGPLESLNEDRRLRTLRSRPWNCRNYPPCIISWPDLLGFIWTTPLMGIWFLTSCNKFPETCNTRVKGLNRDSNHKPSCCELIVVTTAPPCCPSQGKLLWKGSRITAAYSRPASG